MLLAHLPGLQTSSFNRNVNRLYGCTMHMICVKLDDKVWRLLLPFSSSTFLCSGFCKTAVSVINFRTLLQGCIWVAHYDWVISLHWYILAYLSVHSSIGNFSWIASEVKIMTFGRCDAYHTVASMPPLSTEVIRVWMHFCINLTVFFLSSMKPSVLQDIWKQVHYTNLSAVCVSQIFKCR